MDHQQKPAQDTSKLSSRKTLVRSVQNQPKKLPPKLQPTRSQPSSLANDLLEFTYDNLIKAFKVGIASIIWVGISILTAFLASWASYLFERLTFGVVGEIGVQATDAIITGGTITLIFIYTLGGIRQAWREVFGEIRIFREFSELLYSWIRNKRNS